MMLIKFSNIEEKIITFRNQKVIIDSDVAELYGIETKRINEAVKNNPNKFPLGDVIELDRQDIINLRTKFSATNFL